MIKKVGLISASVLIVVTSALGGVCGWFLGGMFKKTPTINNDVYHDEMVNYSNNIDGVKAVLSATNKTDISELASVDLSSYVEEGFLKLGDVAQAVQNYVYSHNQVVMKSSNYAESTVLGVTNKQTTNTTWIKYKNLYFKENVSYSSNASFGERTYNYSNELMLSLASNYENNVDYYRISGNKAASNVDYTEASKTSYYINTTEDMVDDDGNAIKSYTTTFGLSLFKCFNYDFSDTTFLKDGNAYGNSTLKNSKTGESYEYEPTITRGEEGYEITFAINGEYLTNYASYILTTTRDASNLAKMKAKPTFNKIGVKLVTDFTLNLLSMHVDEDYDVVSNIAGNVPTSCSSDLTFSYDDVSSIPTIKEKIAYE